MMNLAQRVDSYPLDSFTQAPAFVVMPAQTSRPAQREHRVHKGARIFDASSPFARTYTVASGEVLVHRAGQLVDIVEAGELLDPRFWGDATATAHTDCTLTSPSVGL
jgi:CRP-like cAMP-binding protein